MNFDNVSNLYNNISITQSSAAEKLINLIPQRDYSSVLDIGCAGGINTNELITLIKKGGHYLGIDSSKKMILDAKEKFKQNKFLYCQYEELNINKKFDLLFCNSVFYYFKSPQGVIEISSSLLNDNGIFAIQSQMELCPEFQIAYEYVKGEPSTKDQMQFFTFPANLINAKEYMKILSNQDYFKLESMICLTDQHKLSIDQALNVFKSGPAIPFLSQDGYSRKIPIGFKDKFLKNIQESLTKQSISGVVTLNSPRIYIILRKS